MWSAWNITRCWWERSVVPLRKTVWPFLKKVNMNLPYDLATPCLVSTQEKRKTRPTNSCVGLCQLYTCQRRPGNNPGVRKRVNRQTKRGGDGGGPEKEPSAVACDVAEACAE